MPIPSSTILLAEDEVVIRRAVHAALLEAGFTVQLAEDGDQGRALIDEMKNDGPQLLITDVDMPGCGGEELAHHAREHFARIKLLFTSGMPQPALLKAIRADSQALFLEKPYSPSDLLAAIQQLGVTPELAPPDR